MAKKTLTGKVISNKMQKTVVVQVERKVAHPLYKKIITKRMNVKADTADQQYAIGEVVQILETRPLSRDKHFKVIGVLKRKGSPKS